jgi:Fic family protein
MINATYLNIIDRSLEILLNYSNRTLTENDRLNYFAQSGIKDFIRKDYMNVFKDISTATASRDLKKGVELGVFEKYGTLNKTRYRIIF